MRPRKVTALLLWLALLTGPVWAADSNAGDPGTVIYPHGSPSAGAANADVFKDAAPPSSVFPLVGYVIVFGLLAGAGWIIVKKAKTGRPFGKSEGKLHIRESRMLGNRQFLVVVEYEDSKLLLGVGPGRIDLLSPLVTFPEPEGEGTPPETPFSRTEERA